MSEAFTLRVFVPDGDSEGVPFIDRIREHASQAVFARYLNVTKSLVKPVGARREAASGRLVEAVDTGLRENGLEAVA